MTTSASIARLKRAARDAIHHCGGIDGAAATVERSHSTVGDWNNINHRAFPPLDCAFALDEVAVARGLRPELLHRYAAELGFTVTQLLDLGSGLESLTSALIAASAEFGDIAAEVRDATRDGEVNLSERDRIVAQIDEAQASLAKLRAVVTGAPVRAVTGGDGEARTGP